MLKGIQALRGLAAVGVILFHIRLWEAKNLAHPVSPNWFGVGEAGVDLFFVISGFIMAFIQPTVIDSTRSWLRFLIHRFSRVFPPLWLVLLVLLPVYWLRPGLFNNYCHNRVELMRSFLLLPQDQLPLLAVAWTLVHEVYFYLVVSMILRCSPRARWGAGLGWFVVVAVGFTGFGHQLGTCRSLQLIFSPFSLTFLLGFFLGSSREQLRRVPSPLAVIGLVVGLVGLVLGSYLMPDPGVYPDNNLWVRFACWGVPSAFLVGSAVVLESELPGWIARLQFFGDRSYALYLVHLPIVAACYNVARVRGVQSSLLKVLLVSMSLFACFVVAHLFHTLLEVRSTRWVRAFLEGRLGIRTKPCLVNPPFTPA